MMNISLTQTFAVIEVFKLKKQKTLFHEMG